jgi:hypothetical protein
MAFFDRENPRTLVPFKGSVWLFLSRGGLGRSGEDYILYKSCRDLILLIPGKEQD